MVKWSALLSRRRLNNNNNSNNNNNVYDARQQDTDIIDGNNDNDDDNNNNNDDNNNNNNNNNDDDNNDHNETQEALQPLMAGLSDTETRPAQATIIIQGTDSSSEGIFADNQLFNDGLTLATTTTLVNGLINDNNRNDNDDDDSTNNRQVDKRECWIITVVFMFIIIEIIGLLMALLYFSIIPPMVRTSIESSDPSKLHLSRLQLLNITDDGANMAVEVTVQLELPDWARRSGIDFTIYASKWQVLVNMSRYSYYHHQHNNNSGDIIRIDYSNQYHLGDLWLTDIYVPSTSLSIDAAKEQEQHGKLTIPLQFNVSLLAINSTFLRWWLGQSLNRTAIKEDVGWLVSDVECKADISYSIFNGTIFWPSLKVSVRRTREELPLAPPSPPPTSSPPRNITVESFRGNLFTQHPNLQLDLMMPLAYTNDSSTRPLTLLNLTASAQNSSRPVGALKADVYYDSQRIALVTMYNYTATTNSTGLQLQQQLKWQLYLALATKGDHSYWKAFEFARQYLMGQSVIAELRNLRHEHSVMSYSVLSSDKRTELTWTENNQGSFLWINDILLAANGTLIRMSSKSFEIIGIMS